MTDKKRIIIVEDDFIHLQLMSSYLTRQGYAVAGYCHGEIAVDAYQNRPASLVITDIFLPDIDGIDLIRALKQIDPKVKIISMSAMGPTTNVDHLAVSLSLGCSHAFNKPINFSDLSETIKGMI